VYRNIADLEAIMHYAERPGVKHATVVGGGLLGLEAAKAVYDLPTVPEVSIINRQGYPLSRQLDEEGGEMVLRKIEAMGVQVFTNVNVSEMNVKQEEDGKDVFTGFDFTDGESMEADLVIFAVGITPRDELARESGIKVAPRGGIAADDSLMTSAQDVYAIGECCSWRGNTYGLIGPGVEMADILAFNLCQTSTTVGSFRPRKMNAPDLSTKLKLMGVDVASVGDFFADKVMGRSQKPLVETLRNTGKPEHPNTQVLSDTHVPEEPEVPQTSDGAPRRNGASAKRIKIAVPQQDEPIKCLTYKMSFERCSRVA
jgi:nitrite reductase (NAD(P)H)